MKYDHLNRIIQQGELKTSTDISELRRMFKEDSYAHHEERKDSTFTDFYTDDLSYPSGLSGANYYKDLEYWYDDYEVLDKPNIAAELSFNASVIPSTGNYETSRSTKVKGLLTLSKNKMLDYGTGGYSVAELNTWQSLYYDDYGNLIQSIETNHLGGYDISCNWYADITNELRGSHQVHRRLSGDAPIIIAKGYEYDHTGRLLETACKIGTDDTVRLNTMRYDVLGNLKAKYLHGVNDNYSQKVDYNYNIRGWMTGINDPANLGDDLFGMKLYYNDLTGLTINDVNHKSCYNGNISAWTWNTQEDLQRGYTFKYDELNRLVDCVYSNDNSFTFSFSSGSCTTRHDAFYSYDENGNLETLDRYKNHIEVDDLAYTYKDGGNQLLSITETADNNQLYSKYSTQNYAYDEAGNMTHDQSKDVDISYHYLNLPYQVSFNQSNNAGNIYYLYDATGRKVLQNLTSNNSSEEKTTEYLGNFIYTDGNLSTIITEEGRIVPNDASASSASKYRYEYNLKDHLGNTRATFAGTSFGADLIQTASYYPFGLVMVQENFTRALADYEENQYLYNGKEMQNEGFDGIELGWLDYGWRMYDPVIGRWHCIDPMIEKHYDYTPYAYVYNNPMLYVDPFGLDSAQINAALDESQAIVDANPNKDATLYHPNGDGTTGAKGKTPGEAMDCSGMGSNWREAGDEPNPVGTASGVQAAENKFGKGNTNGVRQLAGTAEPVEKENVEPGNEVYLNNYKHVGLVTSVAKDFNGNTTSITFQHSGCFTGPTTSTANLNGTGYWGSKITSFGSWDTRPNTYNAGTLQEVVVVGNGSSYLTPIKL